MEIAEQIGGIEVKLFHTPFSWLVSHSRISVYLLFLLPFLFLAFLVNAKFLCC